MTNTSSAYNRFDALNEALDRAYRDLADLQKQREDLDEKITDLSEHIHDLQISLYELNDFLDVLEYA